MAKKSMINKETRRKYDIRVRNRCKVCGRPARIYPPLWAVPHLLSVSWPWKEKSQAWLSHPGSRVEVIRMAVTDPIADMLTRIRNAGMAGHITVAMPNSKIKVAIAKILKEEGFIAGYEIVDGKSPEQSVAHSPEVRRRAPRASPGHHRPGAGQPPWPPGIHRKAGYPLGAVWDGHCHPSRRPKV
jgi:hypothetical protein